MFPDYMPPEELEMALSQAAIVAADIDPETRSVHVAAHAERYIPRRLTDRAADEISRLYGLHSLQITVTHPASQLTLVEPEELMQMFVSRNSMTRGSLAGARWGWDQNCLTIQLVANGKGAVEEQIPAVTRELRERFGTDLHICVEAGKTLEGEALFQAMESMRESIMTALPAQKKAPRQEERAPVDSETFYGKPFRGNATPMNTLNMDMGTIIVEGKVFAVEHKELTKRNAWVVKFDMTDNTNSIRISRFLEAREAKPIIENVQVGSILRVQGKLIEDRFENEMVLKPYAMMPGSMPKRKDTAPDGKRVELHLHTTMSNMDALTETAAAVKQAAAWGHRAIAIQTMESPSLSRMP